MSDLRYIATGLLLKKGQIKFSDIYKHIPPTVVAEIIGSTFPRVKKLQEDPRHWTVFEIDNLAEKLQVEPNELFVKLYNEIQW